MKRRHSDVFGQVLLALCESIDTPRALSVWLCFKYNQAELVALPPADLANNNTKEYLLDYFITEYLSKSRFLKTSIDTRGVAIGKWKSAEQSCLQTNIKFRGYQLRPFTGRVETALFRAQRKIASVLGPLCLSKVLADCKWGPGATYDLRRAVATPDKKISQTVSVTQEALPYLRAVVRSDPHWSACFLGVVPEGPFSFVNEREIFSLVRGSRLLCVPKSAKTDRVIAAEPTGNSFLQQGVHSFMRRRLKRFGVDLDDQSINQRGAQDAYTRGLSTLDLSAASDTISTELVYHLLPLDWALFLDSIRSPETQVNGEWVRTEKFASMGNAFCFELETLIFWALSSSVEGFVDRHDRREVEGVTVYGDDIIVPRRCYNEVVEILTFCGFEVNAKKSYRDGNFFESCGKHYHRSVEVTPPYQKESLSHPSEFIRAYNRLVRFGIRVGLATGADVLALLRPSLRILRNRYPLRPFPRIPFGCEGDDGFLRPLREFSLDQNHGYRCSVLIFVPVVSQAREDALYAYKLRRFHAHRRRKDDQWLGSNAENNPTNVSSSGYAGNVLSGTWRTRVRWVPLMSLTGTLDERSALDW